MKKQSEWVAGGASYNRGVCHRARYGRRHETEFCFVLEQYYRMIYLKGSATFLKRAVILNGTLFRAHRGVMNMCVSSLKSRLSRIDFAFMCTTPLHAHCSLNNL